MVIVKAGRPVAKLVSYREKLERREPGGWEGRVRIHDGFDDLPPEVAAAFRGEHP